MEEKVMKEAMMLPGDSEDSNSRNGDFDNGMLSLVSFLDHNEQNVVVGREKTG